MTKERMRECDKRRMREMINGRMRDCDKQEIERKRQMGE